MEKGKGGKVNVVISEIPYTMIGSYIGKFLSDVASLAETKKTQDISDISNQSSKEGIRIVIELRKDADVDNFINMLYKKTRLEDTFGVNMLDVYKRQGICTYPYWMKCPRDENPSKTVWSIPPIGRRPIPLSENRRRKDVYKRQIW